MALARNATSPGKRAPTQFNDHADAPTNQAKRTTVRWGKQVMQTTTTTTSSSSILYQTAQMPRRRQRCGNQTVNHEQHPRCHAARSDVATKRRMMPVVIRRCSPFH
ncbi:uncharacterized protein LACBIDRAFT_315329 [Laccaria bicolor S238N-H82]|nr:uncharacterized protein LACBIDRAFT_315329 [Laccaria bicolor S238N-H82]EDR11042.1 predicted protein [Laccaria bicolor S238N-H82]|eukprot:XP_001878343.1 predicted protein [Laccaria bicolor S238N-H82]